MLTVVTIAPLTPATLLQLSLLPDMKATQCNLVCHITSEDILGPMMQGSADVSCRDSSYSLLGLWALSAAPLWCAGNKQTKWKGVGGCTVLSVFPGMVRKLGKGLEIETYT